MSVQIPLCVDLDGTLIKGDMLLESLKAAIRHAPVAAMYACAAAPFSRAKAKKILADRLGEKVGIPPFTAALVDFLYEQKKLGRKVLLVTATHAPLAERVARELPELFDEVCGSDGNYNLKGIQKARYLISRFGEKGFDYIGNSSSDYAIWRHAREVFVVSDSLQFIEQVTRSFKVKKSFVVT